MYAIAIRVFRSSVRPPKIAGVHRTFPHFVRAAYAWLLVSAAISVSAALWDRAGGLWGASRHALTVGFMAAMAGDRPGFEEASRALFAGDLERFGALVEAWPADVRDHLRRLAI